MSKDRVKFYLRGTGIILVILALVLVSCYGVANNGDENVRKIFYICFGSISLALLVAYWVYAFIYEKKHAKKETEIDYTSKPKDRKNRK